MERVRFFFLVLALILSPATTLLADPGTRGKGKNPNQFSLFEENGKVGLKDEQGHVLIPATYDAIGWSDGKLSVIDKVVGYRTGALWGLIHTSNRVLTPPEYLDLRPGEANLLIACKKSPLSQRRSFGVINASGKVVLPFDYDGLELINMRAIVISRSGNRFLSGLTDMANQLVIPLQYQRIYSLGSLRFAVENFAGKIAIYSDEGSQLTAFSIDSISDFKKDHAIIYQNQRQGLINRSGQVVLEPKYSRIAIDTQGAVRVKEVDWWSILTGDNQVILRHQADSILPLSTHHYAVALGGKQRLCDNKLEPLHPDHFSSLWGLHDGHALFRQKGKTGVIADEGGIIIPAVYQEIRCDKDVYLAAVDTGYKNRWTILDRSGSRLTDKLYEEILPFNGKFFPVRNRGYWGGIDSRGKQLIACVHDSLVQRSGTNVAVRFKGEYGVIDLEENWIVTPQPHPVRIVNDSLYFEFSDKITFVKSFSGDIVYFSENTLEYEGQRLRERLSSGASWTVDLSGVVTDRSAQPEETEAIYPESEGFRAIRRDGKFGFVDNAGRLRVANRYEDARAFSDGMAAIRIMGKWGFIDKRERLIVQPVYDEVHSFAHGLAVVRQDGFEGLIDVQGKLILPLRYDEIKVNDHHRFLLRQGKSYGLADRSGLVAIHPRYDRIIDPGTGFVIAERNGKAGLLTLGGVSTIPMVYDAVVFDKYRGQYLGLQKAAWQTIDSAALLPR